MSIEPGYSGQEFMPEAYERIRTVRSLLPPDVHVQGDGIHAYHFYLFSPGAPGDLSKPNLTIQLLFGAAPDDGTPPTEATSPVNQAEAMQAWDSVLASIHYRGPK